MHWRWANFAELDAAAWHQVALLRQAVFVLEQQCRYYDLDDIDPQCLHLLGYDTDLQVRAYLRLVPPGLTYPTPSLGRIVVDARVRRQGWGRQLVHEGLAEHRRLYSGADNTIGAQAYLKRFYESLGYVCQGEVYPLDGIPHIDMHWSERRDQTSR